MSTEHEREPFNNPAELLDELDAIASEQESLRLRVVTLAARYRELEPFSDRFDKPGPEPWRTEEFGSVNLEFAGKNLAGAARDMENVQKYGLRPARKLAEKVREYPQHEQADRERGRSR